MKEHEVRSVSDITVTFGRNIWWMRASSTVYTIPILMLTILPFYD